MMGELIQYDKGSNSIYLDYRVVLIIRRHLYSKLIDMNRENLCIPDLVHYFIDECLINTYIMFQPYELLTLLFKEENSSNKSLDMSLVRFQLSHQDIEYIRAHRIPVNPHQIRNMLISLANRYRMLELDYEQ
jgi:hypothetical protein